MKLNKRQQEVLEFIGKNEPAQVGDIEKALKGYSRNTLKKDLAYLMWEGLLLMTGDRRGARYHILKNGMYKPDYGLLVARYCRPAGNTL